MNYFAASILLVRVTGVFCQHFENIDIRIVKGNKQILLISTDEINNEEEVTNLWIEGQKVSKLRQGTFENLLKVESIKIEECGLSEIDKNAFNNLPKLRILNLNRNALKTIKSGLFAGLQITRLYLAMNAIESFEAGAFHDISYLEVLDLSHNYLTNLHPHMFKGSPNLRTVNLNFNKLTVLPAECFLYGFSNAAAEERSLLDLSDNQLTYINRKSIDGVYNIKEISFKNNELLQLAPNTFDGIGHIEIVDLGNNHLTFLNGYILRQLRHSRLVKVDGNPWNCGFAKKFTEWCDKHNKTNTIDCDLLNNCK